MSKEGLRKIDVLEFSCEFALYVGSERALPPTLNTPGGQDEFVTVLFQDEFVTTMRNCVSTNQSYLAKKRAALVRKVPEKPLPVQMPYPQVCVFPAIPSQPCHMLQIACLLRSHGSTTGSKRPRTCRGREHAGRKSAPLEGLPTNTHHDGRVLGGRGAK